MAGQTIGSLLVRIGSDISGLQKGLNKAERSLMRFGNKMQNIGTTLSATVSLPIAAVGGAAVRSAAQFEQLEASLAILTGSAEKGAAVFERLKKFAATTPFELGDIVNAEKQLLAFGFSVENSFNALQYLGDIAAATGGDLNGLTTILGQAKAIGAVYTQDLRQLANRGIPIFDVLQEQLQVTGEELNKMVTGGQIDFATLEDALKSMTQEGGLFFQGMQKQSQTTAGAFSNFQDSVNLALADFGKSIMETFNVRENLVKFSAWVQGLQERFSALSDTQKRTIVVITAMVAAIGPLLIGIASLAKLGATVVMGFKSLLGVFALLTSPIGLIVAGIVALAAGFAYAYQKSERFRAVLHGVGAVLVEIVKIFSEAIQGFVRGFQELREGEFKKAAASFSDALVKANPLSMAFAQGGRLASAYSDGYQKSLEKDAEKDKFDPYADKQGLMAQMESAGQAAGKSFTKGMAKEITTMPGKVSGFSEIFAGDYNLMGVSSQAGISDMAKPMDLLLEKIREAQGATLSWRDSFAKTVDTVVGGALKMWDTFSEAFAGLEGVIGQFFANRQAAIDTYYENERRRIEGSRMSEEQRNKALQALDEETEKRRKKLARQQAIRDKALGIVQAIINTAVAVTKYLANPVLAGIVGAAGAAQVALIASQKIPALAQGGLAYAPTMAMVGDNRGARVDPEVIAPLSKLRDYMGGAQNVIVTGRISGRDILLVQERAQQDRERVRGF